METSQKPTLDGGGEQGRNKQKRYRQTLNHNIFIILIIPIIIDIITRRSAAVVDHLVSKDLALFDGGQLLQQLLQANIFVT